MRKEIKTLINKKKLTGVEVGKLLIKDMLTEWEAANKDPKFTELNDYPGIFTQAERESMVSQLTGSQNIRDYNAYREIHNALIKFPMRFSMYKEMMESHFWRVYVFLDKTVTAEEENSQRRHKPSIMTQKQYDDLLQQAHDKNIKNTDSIESLFFHALDFYFSKHKEGERTPYSKHFNAAKKKKITNPRISENYWIEGENGHYVTPDGKTSKDMTGDEWQVEVIRLHANKKETDPDPLTWIDDGTAAPDTATMFDVLEYADGFYSVAENDDETLFAEFATDFPGLYKDLLHEITHTKSLEFLAGRTDFFNADLIPWQTLYDNNLYDYRSMIDNVGGWGDVSGIAILHPEYLPSRSIDEKGYYSPDPSVLYAHHRIEALYESFGRGVLQLQAIMKNCLAECHAMNEAVRLIAEAINLPEIERMIKQFQQIDPDFFNVLNLNVERLYTIINRFEPYGLPVDIDATEKARAMAKELFHPLHTDEGKPTPENIKKAREYISDIRNIYEHTEIFYSILRGGGAK